MKEIAILGGSGFVGSEIVEYALEAGMPVRPIVRKNGGPRLGRHRIKVLRADLSNDGELSRVLDGCSVAINCSLARPRRAAADDLPLVNEQLCGSIIRACATAGVGRLVHLSSIAVLPPRLTSEALSRPWSYSGLPDWYTQSKVRSEELLRTGGGEVEVCLLRAGVVYGAHSAWSRLALERCDGGAVHVPDPGASLCAAVHGGDLARLALDLARHGGRPPELVYGINPERRSWLDFYRAHASAAGLAPAVRVATDEELRAHLPRRDSRLWSALRRCHTSRLTRRFHSRGWYEAVVAGARRQRQRGAGPDPDVLARQEFWPDERELLLYQSTDLPPRSEAGGQIGFAYRIGLADGAADAARWWSFAAGMMPSAARAALSIARQHEQRADVPSI